MYNKFKLVTALCIITSGIANAQNTFPASGAVGIGTASPNSSSILDITSTTKGVLLPRMTKNQRDAIGSPVNGLLIFQTDNNKGLYYYNGSSWTSVNNVRGLSKNIFIGSAAGNSNSTGSANIALGAGALKLNTDRIENIAIGDSALYNLGTGSIGNQAWYNTAVGSKSQKLSTTGTKNTSVGAYSLYNVIAGNDNVAVGYNALFSNNYNHNNVAVGENALYSVKADYNTACGNTAGSGITFSSECSFFGYDADQTGTTTYINATALGSASRTTGNAQVRVGNSSVTSIGGFASFTNVSDGRYKKEIKENVPGLAFINKLKPVTYHLDVKGLRTFLHEDRNDNLKSAEAKARIEQGIATKEQILYSGFVAQDVERAAMELGYDFSGVDKPQNNESLYGLRYAEFTVPLVKAVQELDAMNKELKSTNEKLEARIAALENSILQTESKQLTENSGQTAIGNSQLFQNQPNPFNQSTIIRYQLSGSDVDAKIIIRDLNSNLVKQLSISQSGKGQVIINANELAQGTYTYTLEINGQSVDTKLMVVTK